MKTVTLTFVFLTPTGMTASATSGSGGWYVADNVECKLWIDEPEKEPDRVINWYGECVNGRAQGTGRITWSLGDGASKEEYVGAVVDGRPHGFGVLKDVPKATRTYGGYWVKGRFHGHGTQESPEENYIGAFTEGKRQGQGLLIFGLEDERAGDRIIGSFDDDLPSGVVLYRYADGKAFVGKLDERLRPREGVVFHTDGRSETLAGN